MKWSICYIYLRNYDVIPKGANKSYDCGSSNTFQITFNIRSISMTEFLFFLSYKSIFLYYNISLSNEFFSGISSG